VVTWAVVLLIARVLYHTPDCPGKGRKWDSLLHAFWQSMNNLYHASEPDGVARNRAGCARTNLLKLWKR
jgi:hypothetical protein